MPKTVDYEQSLKEFTIPGKLYKKLDLKKVHCFACAHNCMIQEGKEGICKVRFNEDGILKVPYGYVCGLNCDPIEKKPFYHVLPGAKAMSFGMLGCDFHCTYCQNWLSSQVLRDPEAGSPPMKVEPADIVNMALKYHARIVTSTYNEPLITSEWAVDIFKEAKKKDLHCSMVSNGHGTPEVIEFLKPYVEFFKVDLKSFNKDHYRNLGGKLEAVQKTIELLKEKGFWVEIVTLVIPGFNDSDAELKQMASFIASISKNIPWHVTAFHKDYQLTDAENTPVDTLIRACQIGRAAGLHFCYAGNIPGSVGDWENTHCPSCDTLLVERYGYTILKNNIHNGNCFKCNTHIAGFWS